jgi:hypothetical protein
MICLCLFVLFLFIYLFIYLFIFFFAIKEFFYEQTNYRTWTNNAKLEHHLIFTCLLLNYNILNDITKSDTHAITNS